MSLTLFRRGEVWYYRGTVAGRRLRGSTRTEDQAIAERVAARQEADAWKGHLDGPEAVLSFAKAAILYRGAGKSWMYLDRIEDYWKDTLVRDITSGAIREAARKLRPGLSPASWNRQVLVPTQAVINHAADLGLCRPMVRLRRFPETHTEKEPASWPWVEAFMAKAPPRIAALACFLYLTGARISEAIDLTWDDVNLTRRQAIVRSTKVGLVRRVHLPDVLMVALANLPHTTERVFGYANRWDARRPWLVASKAAGLPPLSFHACRHGFATGLLSKRISPVAVAKRGGWKSVAHVFRTYGHDLEDEALTDVLVDAELTQETALSKKTK